MTFCRDVRSGQIDSTASKIGSRLEQHAFAAAEGPVIDRAVQIVGPGAQIVNAISSAPDSAARATTPCRKGPSKKSGKMVRM